MTIAVPPALPSAMAVGTLFAMGRLKAKKIFCISPPRVNVSGRVNFMVFDKTGTLTEDGLQVYGFRGVEDAVVKNKNKRIWTEFSETCDSLQPNGVWWNDKADYEDNVSNPKTQLLENLATCHSITYVNGELIGDPLDVKMF